MDLRLDGRAALVTGASRGIGLAVVRALRDEGARVVGVARSGSPELAATGATVVEADLASPDGARRAVTAATNAVGDLDVLVNNVGGGDVDQLRGFLDLDDGAWARSFEVNLFSAVRTTRHALPGLVRRGGAVVNVSSVGARLPAEGPYPYTTAKAALTALGTALSEEFGPQGVRVTTVTPGPTRTALWEDPDGPAGVIAAAHGVDHAELLRGLPAASRITIGRLVEPGEVASLVAYLVSPVAGAATGADYRMDGGTVKYA